MVIHSPQKVLEFHKPKTAGGLFSARNQQQYFHSTVSTESVAICQTCSKYHEQIVIKSSSTFQ